MDDFTLKHLETWLKTQDRHAEQDRADILLALASYPELLADRSWPEIRDVGARIRTGDCMTNRSNLNA